MSPPPGVGAWLLLARCWFPVDHPVTPLASLLRMRLGFDAVAEVDQLELGATKRVAHPPNEFLG